MNVIWNSKGLKIEVTSDKGRKLAFLTFEQDRVVLTKSEAFELAHTLTDEMRRFPKCGLSL